MTNDNIIREWHALKRQINRFNDMYRVGLPLIDDEHYDSMINRFRYLSSMLGTTCSIPKDCIDHQRIQVQHEVPMLSIEHGFGKESIKKFIKRIKSTNSVFPIIGEHKIDGIAISITYKYGKIEELKTRGNGIIGNQVNDKIDALDVVKNIDFVDRTEIRGELFITKDNFVPIANEFASPRNAVAAVMQSIQNTIPVKLNFIPYNVITYQDSHQFTSYSGKINFLRSLGFETQQYKILQDENDVIHYYQHIQNNKNKLPYSIDGIVLKIDNLHTCMSLGYTRHAPRYMFAAKFNNQTFETKILDIEFQVGKHGTITPVAIFEKISVDGCNLSRASLSNYSEYTKNEYGPGDRILISRSGDAVPHIVSKIHHAGSHIPITRCPSCKSILKSSNQALFCEYGWQCSKQKTLRTYHFASRDSLNITSLGMQNIQKIIDINIINYPSDILTIPDRFLNGEIIAIPGFAKKSMIKLISSIISIKDCKTENLIYSLGIPNVGKGHAQTLASHYKAIENFFDFDSQHKLHNIGSEINQSISLFLNNPSEKWIYDIPDFIKDLKKCKFTY